MICLSLYNYHHEVLQHELCIVYLQGVDPHAFTASMFEGISLPQFMELKQSPCAEDRAKYANLRQRAKVSEPLQLVHRVFLFLNFNC